MSIILGITGSIGMGKTTVSNMLRDRGIPVHCADEEVHRLLGSDGSAVSIVRQVFPESYDEAANGINRNILGKLVFDDPEKKKQLEDILHPMVRHAQDAFIDAHQDHDMIGLDIPLLFETEGENRVDYTICASAPIEIQRARILARPGMTPEKCDAILAAQMPDTEKRARADYVIETGVSMDDTRQMLDTLITKIKAQTA